MVRQMEPLLMVLQQILPHTEPHIQTSTSNTDQDTISTIQDRPHMVVSTTITTGRVAMVVKRELREAAMAVVMEVVISQNMFTQTMEYNYVALLQIKRINCTHSNIDACVLEWK